MDGHNCTVYAQNDVVYAKKWTTHISDNGNGKGHDKWQLLNITFAYCSYRQCTVELNILTCIIKKIIEN